MKRIILLLVIISPSFMFAANYVNEFPTYLYGDIRPIAAIYNAIAMISGDTIYKTIISISVLYSIFNLGFIVITKADLIGALKSGSFTIGALSVLLVPVDVHLVDKRLDKGLITNYYDSSILGYEKISNVPWLVALTPSVATTISSDLIELVDAVFKGNTVNYAGMKDIGKVGFADIGFGNAYESINKIVENYSFDELGTVDALNFKSDFKSYLSDCVLPMSVTNKKVSANLLAPTKDIYSALAPAEIGVDNTYSITRRDGTSTDCVTFYNNEIKTNIVSLTTDTNAKIAKLVGVPDVLALKGLDRIALADIQSDVFSGSTAQLTIYAQNLAAAPLIQSLFENYYRGTQVSGQDIANNITGSKSTAAIQTQGLGQFKWMSQILPYALHFLFGIILASSILTIIMAMARGLYQGSAVARNYFSGFIQFESIRVSLALVNNLVLYYSVIGAADKLTAFGGNPIAITRIPSYLNYIATMEGVSGILGISAIFIIPMIALKGDVTSAASAMQSLSGRYQGNDIETANDAISRSSAREKALATNEDAINSKLSKMGLSVPPGRAAIDYYNSVTSDLSKMNSGIGNMVNQDKMNDFSKGVVAKTTSDINNTAGYGSTANLDSVAKVSQQDGQAMGITTNNTDSMRGSMGWDASKVGRGRALEGVGKDISTMGASDSVKNGDLEQYAKGSSNQGKMNVAKTLGSGLVNLTNKDLEDLQYGSKSGIESEVGKARGVRKNYDQFGENAYKEQSEYGERSGMAKTMAKLSAQGGMEGAITIDTKDSSFKSSQQKGSVEGTEETANKIKSAGESIGDALSRISKELTSGKLASDNRMINEFNENYKHGGFVGAQADSASLKAAQTMGNLKAQRSFEFLGDNGMTEKGLKSNEIAPIENAAIADAKYSTFYGDKAQQSAESVANELRNSSTRSAEMEAKNEAIKKGLNKDDTKKLVTQAIATKNSEVDKKFQELGITNDKGIVQSGDEMVAALAKMGAMNYASSKTLTFDGMDINMGIDSSNGQAKVHKANASRNVSAGDANSFDNVTNHKTGTNTEYYNDKKALYNTEALTTLALKDSNGNLNDAARLQRNADMAKWAMDPRNELSLAAGKVADIVTPNNKDDGGNESGETAALVAGSLGAGGAALYAFDKVTKKPIKVDIEKYNPITDDKGNLQGYEDEKGNKVADKNGYKLNEHGEKIKKGTVGRATTRAWESSREKFKETFEKISPFSRKEKPLESTNQSPADGSPDHNNNEPKNSTSDHVDSSNKNNSNYNTNSNEMPHETLEKNLNQQKIDLANKNPESLARETFVSQANMKAKENLDAFREGSIDKQAFSDKNAKLATFMSKVENGADISPKELESLGIKSTSELPLETKMSKNNKPYQVVNTSEYGQQLKEIEAQKFRDVETKVSNSEMHNDIKNENIESSGNSKGSMSPKEVGENELKNKINERRNVINEAFKNGEMKTSEYETQKTKLSNIEDRLNSGKDVHANKLEQAGISTKGISSNNGVVDLSSFAEQVSNPKHEIQHPKITGFATHAEAKASGMFDFIKHVPFLGKVAALGMAGVTLSEAKEEFEQGNYGKAALKTISIAPIDPGVSDMLLTTIETGDKQKEILNGRTLTGIGSGWQNDLKNSSIGKQVSSLIGSDNTSEATPSNFANVLRDGQVRAEFGAMNQEQNKPITQKSMEFTGLNSQSMSFNNGELEMQKNQMSSSISDKNSNKEMQISEPIKSSGTDFVQNQNNNIETPKVVDNNMQLNTQNMTFDNGEIEMQKLQMMEMRNTMNELQESKQFSDIQITREEFENMQKDLKRIRKR